MKRFLETWCGCTGNVICIPEVSPRFARLRCVDAKQPEKGQESPRAGTATRQYSKKRSRARSSTTGQHRPGNAGVKPLLLLRNACPGSHAVPAVLAHRQRLHGRHLTFKTSYPFRG